MRSDAVDIIERMERSVQRLAWAMLDCEPEDLAKSPGKGEWSPMQILAHLKACDDGLTLRIALLLTHPQPILQRFDVTRWEVVADYTAAPLDQTLLSYQRHRQETAWQLRRLPDEAWDRTAQHEDRGTIALFDLVSTLVEHEEEHVAHLRELLGIDDDE